MYFTKSFYSTCRLVNSLKLSIRSHKRSTKAKHPSEPIQTRNYSSSRTKTAPGWSEWSGVFTKFVPVGICLIGVMQWRAYRQRSHDRIATDWEVKFYCLLPLRTASRCWGWIADIKLPEALRPVIYGAYINMYQVNLSEASNEDLKSYPSLADFFSRAIKDNAREIDEKSILVSPCDGKVLHFGPVQSEEMEQVKGITYTLNGFFGENTWIRNNQNSDYKSSLLHDKKDSELYSCIIYLAPGDYHRYHSPAKWKPTHRRHFHGKLLSVKPTIANWIPGLFSINERAVYVGEWEHGFFSYTLVGATNVGTIKVYFDKSLQTNCTKKIPKCKDFCFGNSVTLNKGQIVGEFRMGSTIVLVFEAPSNFQFTVTPGMRVKMGQSLGVIGHNKLVDKGHLDRNVTKCVN